MCINGHEWAKRQATKAGIDFKALDNGFLSCAEPERLQRICERLSPTRIEVFVRKWLARLPHPFTAEDRRSGYRYDLSMLQAEFSLTQVLDRPLSGRVFFEDVIRENLDIGRPDQVSLVFDRRVVRRGRHPTPGRFRTRVITEGVTPSVHVYYRRSKLKQYHKEGLRRLRLHGLIERIPGTHRYQGPISASTPPSCSAAPTTGCYDPPSRLRPRQLPTHLSAELSPTLTPPSTRCSTSRHEPETRT